VRQGAIVATAVAALEVVAASMTGGSGIEYPKTATSTEELNDDNGFKVTGCLIEEQRTQLLFPAPPCPRTPSSRAPPRSRALSFAHRLRVPSPFNVSAPAPMQRRHRDSCGAPVLHVLPSWQ